jgi:general stress protein 26
MSTKDLKRFRDLLDGVHSAMLTSVSTDGSLHSRPMALQPPADDGDLWFIADVRSDKAHEIARDQHVNLSFAKGDSRWVSVTGTAQIVHDAARLRDMWSPFAEAWFPNGRENPDIGLLRVAVNEVDFWESSSPKPVRLVKQAVAAATGHPPDLGDSGTLSPGRGRLQD